MKKIFQIKKGILGLALLGTFFFLSANIFEASNKVETLSVLTNGLGTCFYRENQSFTAKLLGTGGAGYLARSFLNGTEDCFAEVLIGLSKDNFKGLSEAKKRLNTLTSEVHWFHQRLSKRSNKFTRGRALELDLKTRFQKLERQSNKVSDLIFIEKEKLTSFLSKAKSLFYFISITFFGIFFWQMRVDHNRNQGNTQFEKDAEGILSEFDEKDLTKVEALFRDLLNHLNLNFSVALFNRFFSEVNDKEGTEKISDTFEEIKKNSSLSSIPLETVEKRVKNMGNERFIAPETNLTKKKVKELKVVKDAKVVKEEIIAEVIAEESSNLENILSKIIDHASSKIFTKGIILDFELDKKIFVDGKTEDLEQIIYHFVLSSMNNFPSNQNKKVIKITSKKLGGVLLFDIQDNGNPFSDSMLNLKTSIEKGEGNESSNIDLDFNIGQVLLNDFGGKTIIENCLDDNGKIYGRKVRLQFTVSNVSERPNLVSLKRGKKKEILNRLSEQI